MSISIVIPLYNKGPHIRRALTSVVRQTFQDFECLVVDDGSTDDGAKVVHTFAERRVRLLAQPNLGVSAARNRGIQEAVHPLIAFLDADDEWHPDFLRATAVTHEAHRGLAACFTNLRKGLQPETVLQPAEGSPRLLEDYFAFVLSNSGVGMHSSSVVASRRHLAIIGGFPVGRTHGEDLDTWMRLAWSGPVAFVPDALSIYHDECGASAAGVSDLDVLPTYREWRRLGRIPARLARSSLAFAALCRQRTAFFRAQAGQKHSAMRLYRDLPVASRFSLLGLASLMSILSYPAGKYPFYAAEVVNRLLSRWRWQPHA